jgi:phage terminase Nu1 subunit (DNA packaging protein)
MVFAKTSGAKNRDAGTNKVQTAVGLQEFHKNSEQKTKLIKTAMRTFQVSYIKATIARIVRNILHKKSPPKLAGIS